MASHFVLLLLLLLMCIALSPFLLYLSEIPSGQDTSSPLLLRTTLQSSPSLSDSPSQFLAELYLLLRMDFPDLVGPQRS